MDERVIHIHREKRTYNVPTVIEGKCMVHGRMVQDRCNDIEEIKK